VYKRQVVGFVVYAIFSPGVEISVVQEPGTGQWEGLQRIEVTATAQAGPRQTTVALARYVKPVARLSSPVARRSGHEPRITSDESRVTSHERRATGDEGGPSL